MCCFVLRYEAKGTRNKEGVKKGEWWTEERGGEEGRQEKEWIKKLSFRERKCILCIVFYLI